MIIHDEVTVEYIAWHISDYFWSGGKDVAELLSLDELKDVLSTIEDIYPDGISATTLNDIFWFDTQFIEETINRSLYPF